MSDGKQGDEGEHWGLQPPTLVRARAVYGGAGLTVGEALAQRDHERTGRNVAFAFALVAACWLGEQAGLTCDPSEAKDELRIAGLWVTR